MDFIDDIHRLPAGRLLAVRGEIYELNDPLNYRMHWLAFAGHPTPDPIKSNVRIVNTY